MRPPPGAWSAAFAGALAAACLLSLLPGGASAQTSRPEVLRIDFHGNRVFDESDLRGAIFNQETTCRPILLLNPPLCWLGVDWAVERSYLQPRELPLDALRLQAYYWLRGYRDAAVDTALVRNDGTVEIDFFIEEGEPVLVESLDISGLGEVETPGILDDLPLEVGDPLSAIELEAVKDTVVSRLREVGYAHAAAFSGFFIPAGSQAAQVTFDVDPGPLVRFGPVSVEWVQGTQRDPSPELSETSIRRMVPFREGGLYRQSQLAEGQRNLYALELIRTAQVQRLGDPEALDTIIPIRVVVNEGELHRVRTGGGWSTADCFSTEAQWASRNFFGGARRLTVRGRISNILAEQLNTSVCPQTGADEFARLNGQFAAELFQPWFFSPRNSLTANAFLERQSLPGIFVREALGFTLALTRNVGRQATVTASYQPTLTRLDAGDVFFCSSFLLCNDEDILVFESANWLSPVGLNFAVNRSNRVLNPTAGYSLGLDLEHASDFTGSDFAYNRAVAEATGYTELGEGVVLAARIRSGLVEPGLVDLPGTPRELSHPQKRFYSGGANSVRGFGENRLGPRVLSVEVERLLETVNGQGPACLPQEVLDGSCDAASVSDARYLVRATGGDAMLEGNVELRFPFLLDPLQGALFVDVGQVWARDENQALAVSLGALEVTPGFGVRFFSPIGPIRMDVGYRFQGSEDLPVLTRSIRPYNPLIDSPSDRIAGLDWVRTEDLQRLLPRVPFGGGDSFFRKLQFHFSIGQAF